MGLSMFIGQAEEVRLTNAVDFNSFLNEVSQYGDFPNLLTRSFSEGKISLDFKPANPTLFNSSVQELLKECKHIEENFGHLLSDVSIHVLGQIKKACNLSKRRGRDITLG